jgi:hypothetical protein
MNQDCPVTLAKHLKTLRTFLNRWRRGTACLWEFQVAHCHLTIRIERSGEPGNLHIICLGPEFIHGPVQWDDCAFEVHLESDQFGATERYVLRDIPANFEVRTDEIEVKENCQPLS